MMEFRLGDRVRLCGRRDVGIGQVVGMRRNGQVLIQWSTGVWPVRRWSDAEELERIQCLHPGDKQP